MSLDIGWLWSTLILVISRLTVHLTLGSHRLLFLQIMCAPHLMEILTRTSRETRNHLFNECLAYSPQELFIHSATNVLWKKKKNGPIKMFLSVCVIVWTLATIFWPPQPRWSYERKTLPGGKHGKKSII